MWRYISKRLCGYIWTELGSQRQDEHKGVRSSKISSVMEQHRFQMDFLEMIQGSCSNNQLIRWLVTPLLISNFFSPKCTCAIGLQTSSTNLFHRQKIIKFSTLTNLIKAMPVFWEHLVRHSLPKSTEKDNSGSRKWEKCFSELSIWQGVVSGHSSYII